MLREFNLEMETFKSLLILMLTFCNISPMVVGCVVVLYLKSCIIVTLETVFLAGVVKYYCSPPYLIGPWALIMKRYLNHYINLTGPPPHTTRHQKNTAISTQWFSSI